MKTTYFYLPQVNKIWRATTKKASAKINRLIILNNDAVKPVTPKCAKKLISQGVEYIKVSDLM